jgi:pimeloyl-ACP methyl ester carboxylesterase
MKLVFIHGSGMNGVVWQQQLDYFENAEALNLPAHPAGELVEGIEAYLDFVLSYLQKQDEDFVIVGHSLGGALALKLALIELDRLKAIVLIGTGARLRVMPMILEMLEKSALENNKIPSMMLAMNDLIAEPLKSQIIAAMASNGANVMHRDLSICDHFDVMNELPNITIPTLVLVGDKDQMTPPKYAEYMVNAMPNAKMEVIKGGTHMVFAEQAERVNVLIEEFLSTLN